MWWKYSRLKVLCNVMYSYIFLKSQTSSTQSPESCCTHVLKVWITDWVADKTMSASQQLSYCYQCHDSLSFLKMSTSLETQQHDNYHDNLSFMTISASWKCKHHLSNMTEDCSFTSILTYLSVPRIVLFLRVYTRKATTATWLYFF